MSTEYIAPITKSQQDLIKYLPELALFRGLAESRKALLGAIFLKEELAGRRRYLSTSEITEQTGYCEKTLQRSRRELEGLGVLSIQQRQGWQCLVYRLHDMFYTEEGIAFLKECALLVKKPMDKVVQGVSTLYISARCLYYKLKDYLGSKRFNYFELMYNFKITKREKIEAWLKKNAKWFQKPMSCLTRKEASIMKEIGYVEDEKPVEYPISETIYSPKSEQPIGFNTAQMWEMVHKREKQQDESDSIQRLAEIENKLRTSELGKEKQELENKVRNLNTGMYTILNQILFGLPRQKEAAKQEQAARQAEIKALGDKIKVIDDKQAELLKEKEVLEAKLSRYRRVKNYSISVVT